MKKLNLITVAAAGCFAVSAFAVLTVASAPAQATPAYAAQEKKACGYCHVSPAGGGPRNAAGKKFEANGHKF
jgi:hypothetical protein